MRNPRAVTILAVFLLFSLFAFAQTGTSSIRGSVVDPQGNAVVGATVTITDIRTNSVRTQTTTQSGTFAFELIQPSDYTIHVVASGFEKATVNGVQALIGKSTDIPISLVIGRAETVVTVEAQKILMNTEDASLGNNFVNEQIVQLPLEARNVLNLLTLQPQVTDDGSVAGARSDQSNVTLDGIDINEAQTNSIATPVLRLNAEAVEEFRFVTTNGGANQGRSSGAQVNLATKRGTNKFHGALFDYYRSKVLTANDYFNNLYGVEKPQLVRHTLGGAIGGPIIKDKLFFFYSYERRTDRASTPVTSIVPMPTLGQGIVQFPGASGGTVQVRQTCGESSNCYTMSSLFPGLVTEDTPYGMNPAALQVLADVAARYPANDFNSGDQGLNTAGYRFNAQTPVNANSHVLRLDYNLNPSQTIFLRGNYIHDNSTLAGAFPDVTAPTLKNLPMGFVFGHTWMLGQNWVNNFRYGLTRAKFSQTGDSRENSTIFRFVYDPYLYVRTLDRSTPVHNFTDDIAWIKGTHTFQFGTNIRLVRNNRVSYANAWDNAVLNPNYYDSSGTILLSPLDGLYQGESGASIQNALTAVIGRYTQYTANFTYDQGGNLLPEGTSTNRIFATEDYDVYFQDTWKMTPNFTLTLGLRYGLSRPVYEMNGYEVKPDISLSEYFQRRVDGAAIGQPYNEPITMELSGPANGKSSMYPWDKNNFQPRVGFAWSPKFLGENGETVIRGGFAMTNDYFGQALAVSFDLNNTLGFSSSYTSPPNQFNVSDNLGPLFTNVGQPVRPLPGVEVPGQLVFPLVTPSDSARRIEQSLDAGLTAPTNYLWNLTFERQLPKGMVLSMSYIGRLGRNLLATRDVMAINNLVDPTSGMDWYTAGGQLAVLRENQTPLANVQPIPYFENLFSSPDIMDWKPASWSVTQFVYYLTQATGADYTYVQDILDRMSVYGPDTPVFYQPQYGALSAWGTIANSNYHGGSISLRQRFQALTLDFNYTFSHSLDDSSGLQNETAYGGGFILNPIRQHDSYSNSDFDVRHQINANWVWQLPFGKKQPWGSGAGPSLNALIGGWQLSGIFRWHSGLPVDSPYDDGRWATNWNRLSRGVRLQGVETCPTRGSDPKLFGCNTTEAFQSWRNARPGEGGDRNVLRIPAYVNLDLGIGKSFDMPWSEGHQLQLRLDMFNATNTQIMGEIAGDRPGWGLPLDPRLKQPSSTFSNFIGIQGDRRIMQIGARYSF